MKKRLLPFAVSILALAGTASAQLADNAILPKHTSWAPADHYGQAIEKHNNYVLVGGPDDDISTACQSRSQMSGGAVLYKDGQVFRKYEGSISYINGFEVGWRVGQSVAISQDWLAIGAPKAFIDKGAVLLVKKETVNNNFDFSPNIKQTIQMPASLQYIEIGNQNSFGAAVAIGRNYLIIGAPNARFQGIDCGVVFIYKLVNGVWNYYQHIVSPYVIQEGDFGAAIGLSDDESKLIIGAPAANSNTGAAYIYQLSPNYYSLKSTFLGNVHKLTDLKFGTSVDITNDRAIVGGNNTTSTTGNSIVTFLYNTTTGWKSDQSIYKPSVKDVAMEGTKALVGEAWFLGGEGRIAHYERRGTVTGKPWVATSTVGLSQAGARTGYAVDLNNNIAVAGVFGYDWPNIVDPCTNNTPDDEIGAALMYQFDLHAGKFFKNNQTALRAEEESSFDFKADNLNQIIVSPNPASELVEIISNTKVEKVTAINFTGVAHELVLSNNTADISNLDAGVYVIQIKTVEGTSIQKLIVE